MRGYLVIGVITECGIDFIDEYKNGNKRIIELSDQPFEPIQNRQTKTKTPQKIMEYRDYI